MSVFILKCIAMLAMVTDHVACVLMYSAPGSTVLLTLRAVGRLAFPVFAFLIVNGFEHTSDRGGYLSRLSLFAIISQLPFSTAFEPRNYKAAVYRGSKTVLELNPEVLKLLPFMLVALGICFFAARRRKVGKRFWAIPLALLLPLFSIKLDGYVLLSAELNVFYTLAVSMAVVWVLHELISNQQQHSRSELLLSLLAVAAAAIYILPFSDYGYYGLLLIVLLYLTKSSRPMQALAVFLWGCWLYNYYWLFILGAAIAALFILLYNGKKGPSFKLGFYLVYPVHLTLLFLLLHFLP